MDHHLQDKLQQFSATPPEGAWKKIADALDTEGTFSERLYQYEEPPPPAVWQNLEQELTEESQANVVPFTTRFRKPLRYAAAACFLAVILMTITLTVKRTEAGALDPDSNTTLPTTESTAATVSTQLETVTGNTDQQTNKEATAGQNRTNSTPSNKNETATASVDKRKTGKAKTAKPVYSSLNNYVFFSDGDGTTRKVSKKMASFINCKDDDARCKQRLQELRQKMAARAMTSDFTGVLEMLRQLQ